MKQVLISALFFLSLFTTTYAKDYKDILQEQRESNSLLQRVGNSDLKIKMPDFVFENTTSKIELQFVNPQNPKLLENNFVLGIFVNGHEIPVKFDEKGTGVINYTFKPGENVNVLVEDFTYTRELNVISLWMIIVPVVFVMLLIALRIFNQRAKNKIAQKTLQVIEASKHPEPAKQKKEAVVQEEEEMLV